MIMIQLYQHIDHYKNVEKSPKQFHIYYLNNRNKIPEGINVREATSADCTGINQLIKDLAMYENVPDKPQIDAKGNYKCGMLVLLLFVSSLYI